MRANHNSRRSLLQLDDNRQSQSPRPSNRTQAASEDPSDPAHAQFDDSSMVVTALVLLTALFFLGFFSIYARRLFTAGHDDDGDDRPHGRRRPPYRGRYGLSSSSSSAPALDPPALRALPLLSYSGAGKEPAGCAVCLSELEEKEAVKAIPGCGHVFHPDCIDAWLLCHGSCPVCRSTQLFGLGSCGAARAHVGQEQGAGEDASTGVELARAREADVAVEAAVEGGASEAADDDGGRLADKRARLMGRSDSWPCRPQQAPASLRRSHSL